MEDPGNDRDGIPGAGRLDPGRKCARLDTADGAHRSHIGQLQSGWTAVLSLSSSIAGLSFATIFPLKFSIAIGRGTGVPAWRASLLFCVFARFSASRVITHDETLTHHRDRHSRVERRAAAVRSRRPPKPLVGGHRRVARLPRGPHTAGAVDDRLHGDIAAMERFRPGYEFWRNIYTIRDGSVAFGSATDGRLLAVFPAGGNWARDAKWSDPALAGTLDGHTLPQDSGERRLRRAAAPSGCRADPSQRHRAASRFRAHGSMDASSRNGARSTSGSACRPKSAWRRR